MSGGSQNRPDIAWLIRDCSEYKDHDGLYFEEQLGKLASSKNDQIRNIRAGVTKGFKKRELIMMPHPTEGDTQLKRLEDLPTKSLSFEFRLKVDNVRQKIMGGNAPSKLINGTSINGIMFAKLFENIIDALNSGKLPQLSMR